MKTLDGIRTFIPTSRPAWRQWLAKNKSTEPVYIVLYRKSSNKHNLTYADAVEEALCFGWIDSTARPRDSESSYLRFTPRKEKSNWSKLNVERANRLIRTRQMTKAGQAMIDIAKKNGAWFASSNFDKLPPDLAESFRKRRKALANYKLFAPFARRLIIQWILNAKRPETRKARVKTTVDLAAKNIRARP